MTNGHAQHKSIFSYSFFRRHKAMTEFLLHPGRGAEYCNQPVCLSVSLFVCLCVREHISGTAGPICTEFCAQIPRGRGSVLLWRHCATLCIFGLWMTLLLAVTGRMTLGGRPDLLVLAVSYVRDWGGV